MIYFLRSEQAGDIIQPGWIKIGTTVRLTERLDQITSDIGHTPSVLAVLDGGHAEERVLHERFAPQRRYGEWFDPVGSGLLELIETEGRPWDGKDERPVGVAKMDRMIVDKASWIANRRRISTSEYLTELVRYQVGRDFDEEVGNIV